jgi:hypothetical protein
VTANHRVSGWRITSLATNWRTGTTIKHRESKIDMAALKKASDQK